MVCPMRGVLVLASLVVAVISSVIGWVMRPGRGEEDWSDGDEGNGDTHTHTYKQPVSTTALLTAAARALIDASTGRYLYRQARTAVRALSASPSPAPSRPRSRRASESSPERGHAVGEEAVPLRRRRVSTTEGLPPLPPAGRGGTAGGGAKAAAADGPLTRSRSGGVR